MTLRPKKNALPLAATSEEGEDIRVKDTEMTVTHHATAPTANTLVRYIASIVEAAPPLTVAQKSRLSALIGGAA